jgi:crotonobetainyl-CoA:carnitine CoA-transferase CaiB-like acyl-CoA transferase
MQTMEHPTHGGFKMPAWPVRVNGKPPTVRASPILGQHTGDVLSTWLGVSATEVEKLKGEGVL